MMLPSPVACGEPDSYHNGSTKDPARDSNGRLKSPPIVDRIVIAWDMEGLNLSGDDKPQHPVLFGCSQYVDSPMVGENLGTVDMLNYICDVGARNPHAIHVGYHFNYDSNMILRHLPFRLVRKLWDKNRVRFTDSNGMCWTVQYFPGKKFVVTRAPTFKRTNFHAKDRTTVTIYDYSSFFGGQAFLTACENILREDLSDGDRHVIAHGKAERGKQSWDNLTEIRHYWSREIVLIKRVFERFRDVMHQAGFSLREWYGPGALANFINSAHNLAPHIAGAQKPKEIMPEAVHEASKIAFSGGRFEAFQLGRIRGPVYAIDINSAYPFALTNMPSLCESTGEWRHVEKPRTIERFGIYRIQFSAPRARPVEFRPMPLFWRDNHGMIGYPNHLEGWYYSPEASIAQKLDGVEILEGWYWDTDSTERPWSFLHDMYTTRQRLGKENLLSIPFKLGPNSLYGKYAQTVGWDEDNRQPPRWHALPIAGWVTSMCRAMLWNVIQQCPSDVIAVETDSVFLTRDPRELNVPIGNGLGEWSLETYDEIVYIQSGMYLTMKDGEWKGIKSRGIGKAEFDAERAIAYLKSLNPGEDWEPYHISTKPRFVGMGAALASNDFAGNWRTWQTQDKEITFGDRGKRRHYQKFCKACEAGLTPWEGGHRTFAFSASDGHTMSHPRCLPWETDQTEAVQAIKDSLKMEGESS